MSRSISSPGDSLLSDENRNSFGTVPELPYFSLKGKAIEHSYHTVQRSQQPRTTSPFFISYPSPPLFSDFISHHTIMSSTTIIITINSVCGPVPYHFDSQSEMDIKKYGGCESHGPDPCDESPVCQYCGQHPCECDDFGYVG